MGCSRTTFEITCQVIRVDRYRAECDGEINLAKDGSKFGGVGSKARFAKVALRMYCRNLQEGGIEVDIVKAAEGS
jgi:hypothetical protein